MKIMSTPNVKRVVSTFILQQQQNPKEIPKVALFHRCDTMPTFPSHWAVVSGSIEQNETPYETAYRELCEETNLIDILGENIQMNSMGGMYVDVKQQQRQRQQQTSSATTTAAITTSSSSSNRNKTAKAATAFGGRTIRVYPFSVFVPQDFNCTSLQLKGTEHDGYTWVPVSELSTMQPQVPLLEEAFHYATFGKYLVDLPKEIQEWSQDFSNGAAFLAKKAVKLADKYPSYANYIQAMRPTMVPIVNAIQYYLEQQQNTNVRMFGDEKEIYDGNSCHYSFVANSILSSMDVEAEKCVKLGVERLLSAAHKHQEVYSEKNTSVGGVPSPLIIITYSRSTTIKEIILQFLKRFYLSNVKDDNQSRLPVRIICAKSTPGDEGILMAKDIRHETAKVENYHSAVSVEVIDDENLYQLFSTTLAQTTRITEAGVVPTYVIMVGADCIISNRYVINKIGTKKLVESALKGGRSHRVYCCADGWKLWKDEFSPPLEPIFELLPYDLFTEVLVSADREEHEQNEKR